MVFTPWKTAHGEAEPALLRCESIVALSPEDDSVDTNSVIIEGAGTINSFGPSPHQVLKRVKFVPLVLREADERAPPGAPSITLVNSSTLNLLGKKNRAISAVSYGMYHCDGSDTWNEVYFVQQGAALINDLEERIQALEERLRHA